MKLSFEDLREANAARQKEWPGNDEIDIPFRVIEVAGEAGEVAEAVKKWLRAERGIAGTRGTITEIGEEMADVIIAMDLLAEALGLDLGLMVAQKFNVTSIRYGLKTRLTMKAN